MAISTEKELGEALKNNQDSIEIEGDLSRKVLLDVALSFYGHSPAKV